MKKIYFHELNISSSLLHKRDLKQFLLSVFEKEKKKITRVDIIFCKDKYLLSLNKKFLNHNYNTDTLSFLLSKTKEPIRGELYLSVDRIKVNARVFNIPYQNELLRVVIHSCLHLCGYLDSSKTAAKKMETLQEAYLKKWNVSRETQIGR